MARGQGPSGHNSGSGIRVMRGTRMIGGQTRFGDDFGGPWILFKAETAHLWDRIERARSEIEASSTDFLPWRACLRARCRLGEGPRWDHPVSVVRVGGPPRRSQEDATPRHDVPRCGLLLPGLGESQRYVCRPLFLGAVRDWNYLPLASARDCTGD